MAKQIIIKFWGNFDGGFQVELPKKSLLLNKQESLELQRNTKILAMYEEWRKDYLILISTPPLVGTQLVRGHPLFDDADSSDKENRDFENIIEDCQEKYADLIREFKQWLQLGKIYEKIRVLLKNTKEEVRIIILTKDTRLMGLPWHECENEFDAKVVVALGSLNYKPPKEKLKIFKKRQVRILAIISEVANLEVNCDRQTLEELSVKEKNKLIFKKIIIESLKRHGIIFYPSSLLEITEIAKALFGAISEIRHQGLRIISKEKEADIQPEKNNITREDFIRLLKDNNGWQIFLFAGHSYSDDKWKTGYIQINNNNKINIKYLLEDIIPKAIDDGLKLAIFNSCDGVWLANRLADVDMPQSIVMREKIPDKVAALFFKSFTEVFVREGKSLYSSLAEARSSIKIGFEDEYPGIASLPLIYQNPAVEPPTWNSLKAGPVLVSIQNTYKNLRSFVCFLAMPFKKMLNQNFKDILKITLQVVGLFLAFFGSYYYHYVIDRPIQNQILFEIVKKLDEENKQEYSLVATVPDKVYLIQAIRIYPSYSNNQNISDKNIKQAQFKFHTYSPVKLTKTQESKALYYEISKNSLQTIVGKANDKFSFEYSNNTEDFEFYFLFEGIKNKKTVEFGCTIIFVTDNKNNNQPDCLVKEKYYPSLIRVIPWWIWGSILGIVLILSIEMLYIKGEPDDDKFP
ncbi:MAG: CHAT domain-containing protein [Candidatus Parabeggiatoa sp.]|nr:CHAT domain-containing protein [Candidatus Parabeggiatoa sp.]